MTDWPARLSVNQYCMAPRPLNEWLDAAAHAGVQSVGLNREHIEAFGFERALRLVRDCGVAITTYSALGYWASGYDKDGRPRTFADNLRNLDEAVQLGAPMVGVSAGGLAFAEKDLEAGRRRAAEGLAELMPHARARGLRVAIEPLHPIWGPYRGVWLTLAQALDLVDEIGGANLGVVIDLYHHWWDPAFLPQLQRAGERVFLVQTNDWSPEMAAVADPLANRALPGDGCIDFASVMDGLASYGGWFDVETNNDSLRSLSVEEVLQQLAATHERTIGTRLVQM